MEFPDWIREEMEKRDWNQSELARRMEMDSGTLGNVLNGNRQAGVDFCIALARALGISREEVFRARGWLLREPERVVPAGTSPLIQKLVEQINKLPPSIQDALAGSFQSVVQVINIRDYDIDTTVVINDQTEPSSRTKIDLLEAALLAHKQMMALPKVTDRMAFLRELAERDREVFDTVEELTSETPQNKGQEKRGNGQGAGVA